MFGRPSPLLLLLEPSQRCNARCGFCYHWREKNHPELTLSETTRVLDEAWEMGARFLYLSGGEPLLHPELSEILRHAGTRGYRISVTTNGSLLAEKVSDLKPWVHGVTVSLDHVGEEHSRQRSLPGLFRLAVDGLMAAGAAGIERRINMSLYRGNLGEVEEMCGLARATGAGLHVRLMTHESPDLDIPAFTPDEASAAAKRMLDAYADMEDVLLTPRVYFRTVAQHAPFKCRPLSLLITVDSAGRVYVPCPRWEGRKEKVAGSIRDAGLADIWYSREAAEIRTLAASCTPGTDCYSSCILDISLLAGLSPRMLAEQVTPRRSLLRYFGGKR